MSLEIVILAAGQGTRMRSALPKVLHPVAGKPMLAHVIDTARGLAPQRIHVVIGHGAERVRERLQADDLNFVVQEQQLGTGHAVAQAAPYLSAERVLILYGDVPLIELPTLERLLQQASAEQLALLTVELDDPTGYGRIIRGQDGEVKAIVEQKDASAEQRAIREGNTGILCVPRQRLEGWLGRLSNANAQGEYYLTDVIAMAVADGLRVATAQPQAAMEVQGANDRLQLAELERFYQLRIARRLMAQGVTLLDPARFDVRGEVNAGRDVQIDVNVVLEGRVDIEDEVQIGPNCTIGSVLESQVHVGNFVELKNAHLHEGVKVGHLTYLGDSEVGARTNIGAGTITCNYDGANKWRTVIGEDVFIGSNNSLVAPVDIGAGATTGAGSTITAEVPAQTLAVGRAKQRVIEGWKRPEKIKKS